MSRLVVVSNRLAAPKGKVNVGGMAVAIHAALQQSGGIWFGWSGEFSEAETTQVSIEDVDGVTYATIPLTAADHEQYYNGFANSALWPLFHFRTDLTNYERSHYDGYLRVNRLFARALMPLLDPGDVVWVHDYHLIPLGQELKAMGVGNPLGFFLHIPFPSSEVLVTLPRHGELIRALFDYDLVGFQTSGDLRSFADYTVFESGGTVADSGRLCAYDRSVRADVFPIGIDTQNFVHMARSPEAYLQREEMLKSLSDRDLIIGVDRLDYSKGLKERMEAYERLLERYPENRNKVTMVQIAPPSRTDIPDYVEVRRELESSAGRINGRFGDFNWVPIRYLNRAFSRQELTGLLQASRVGLVTPFRDGMNLVAKEFVAAQREADPGVLVLSRFAGAARQLHGALIVNPYDTQSVAEALQTALHMSLEERRERWTSMMEGVRDDDVFAWRDRFIAALQRAMSEQPAHPAG